MSTVKTAHHPIDSFVIKHGALIGMISVSALVLLIAVMFSRQAQIMEHSRNVLLHTHEVSEHIELLSDKFKEVALAQRSYIITGKEEYLAPYYTALKDTESIDPTPDFVPNYSIGQEVGILRRLTADNPLQQRHLDKLQRKSAEILEYFSATIELRRNLEAAAINQINFDRGKRLLDEIQRISRAMRLEENRLLMIREKNDEELARSVENFTYVGIAVFYFSMILAIWFATRHWRRARQMELAVFAQSQEIVETNNNLQKANRELVLLNELIKESGQKRLRAVVDHAVDGLITINVAGIIETFNPACEKIFGYRASEVVGTNIKNLMPEPYSHQHDQFISNYIVSGKARIIGTSGREVKGKRKNGEIFPLDLSISEFEVESKKHFSGIVRDITARKTAEAQLQRYLRDLERSNQELDDFAYIASHDLKEPLRGLFNHSSFLIEDYQDKLDRDGVRRLHRLAELCQRMERLVNDLLYFSRLGRTDLAVQETDLNQVIDEIRQMSEPFLKERNARIVLPEQLPTIVCDRPRITEVFRNLITNAVKYNDKSERIIEIGFNRHQPTTDRIEHDVFYVKDNGVGIESEFHQEIFRIFKRLQRATEEKESGTGAGLTFVKKIVERHRGRIWLESEPGKGTTFYFNVNQEDANHEQTTSETAVYSAC